MKTPSTNISQRNSTGIHPPHQRARTSLVSEDDGTKRLLLCPQPRRIATAGLTIPNPPPQEAFRLSLFAALAIKFFAWFDAGEADCSCVFPVRRPQSAIRRLPPAPAIRNPTIRAGRFGPTSRGVRTACTVHGRTADARRVGVLQRHSALHPMDVARLSAAAARTAQGPWARRHIWRLQRGGPLGSPWTTCFNQSDVALVPFAALSTRGGERTSTA